MAVRATKTLKETTDTVKTAAKKVVKKEEPAKTEELVEEKKPVKKAPAKKTTAKKVPAKKTTTTRKTRTVKKTELFIQFAGYEISQEDLVARVKEAWVKDGNKVSEIVTMSLYVKPEDYKAYYVINGSSAGAIDL